MTPALAKDVDPNGEFLRATRETQGVPPDSAWQPTPDLTLREHRLNEIERALKLDPCPEYRKVLRREYLALTEPKDAAA